MGALAFAQSAQAQSTTTTTFPVTANVLEACLVTALPLDFGDYDPTSSTDLDETTTLDVLCTVGTSFEVGLSAGTASGATVTTREMTGSSDTLGYGLFQNVSRSTNWGNTPGTDTPAPITAGVLTETMTVYGRVPAGQNVAAGAYADTITVTVTY